MAPQALRSFPWLVLALPSAVLLGGCGAQGGRIDGPYSLEITDAPEDATVCYELDGGDCSGRIEETVFAVGFNADYLVAARHPHRFEERSLDRSRTEYYYIIRSQDGPRRDPSASVRGPFSEAMFERERQRLGLPQFTREIASLK
jgi:hypothetical protein